MSLKHYKNFVKCTMLRLRINREYPRIPYVSRNLKSSGYILPLIVFKFFCGLRKTFLQEWPFNRSRSSKVIDFGTSRKCVCDFLLVRHTNLGPILRRFRLRLQVFVLITPPLFHPNFGMFPLDQIAHVGISRSIYLIANQPW